MVDKLNKYVDKLNKYVNKPYKYLKKNQFYMLLYFAINLILLLVLNYNFTAIKVTLGKLLDIENMNYILRTSVLLVISIFLISIIPFRMVNKSINKSILFLFCIFSFQILSITLDNKNSYIINNNIRIWVLLLFISLFFINLESAEKESCFCKKIFILLVETTFILFILYFLIGNQKDILEIVTNIINKEKKINSLKFIYYIFKLTIIPMFFIIFYFKIFPSKESYDLEKIEKVYGNKSRSMVFNHDKIDLIKEKIQQGDKKINFNFKEENIKNEFIYSIKKEYEQKYNIIYKNNSYYLNNCHLNINIRKNKKMENMLIIDNVKKNTDDELKNLKRKCDILITLTAEDELFSSRIGSIKKLEKEIELGKDSILVDNIWGNGKTFFIKKFMEKYEKKYEFIYIKVPYFDTKTEFRKKILSEIHRIFKKNKIITSSLKDLMSYFNVNDEGIKLGFINFNFNKLLSENPEDDYREVLISIKDNLNYLEKKVVIILDDFDRIENKGQILEVLNFIGELNIEFNESIALITLSSYEKLSDIVGENVNKKEGKKCLEKYFDKIFYLPNSNLFELIDFFSDVYGISIRKKEIIKKIINLINKYNEKLLVDGEINFRNIERVIKSIKEINIKEQEYDIIYEEAYVFWEVVEYLIPDCWNKLKKYKLDLKNIKMNKEFFYNILLELKWYKILKKIKKREEFVFSILESVRKYKLGEYYEPISYYLSIKDEMLKNEINQKYKFKDYQAVSQIFNFEIDERKKIFNFLMNNSNINKYETLELMISYKLNYNWKYESSVGFFKDIENKEKGELPPDKRKIREFYEFLKKLLLVNLFIDINKIKNLNEKELYTKNDEISYFVKSNEHLSTFFSPFLRKGIEKEEYNNFVQEICKMRKNAEQNIIDDDVKTNIELLKLELINVKYLEEDLSEDLKEIEFLRKGLKNLNKKEKDEISNFLKEKDELLYEMWIDHLTPKQK